MAERGSGRRKPLAAQDSPAPPPRGAAVFVHLPAFERAWAALDLNDEDLRALELSILLDPTRAPVVAGTGGLRKARFAPHRWHQGKRGALRICYVHFERAGLVALMTAYAKNEMGDLSPNQKAEIRKLILAIEKGLVRQQASKIGSRREGR